MTFRCDANSDLDYLEKSLAAYAVEKAVDDFSDEGTSGSVFRTSNGLKVSVREGKTHYEQVDTYINGELVHKNGEKISTSTKSNTEPSDEQLRNAWVCANDVVERELYSL